MKQYFLLTLLGVLLLSCSNEDNAQHSEFIGKTFDHLHFQTEQECIDAQSNPNFFINCHQELSFIDSEKANIMLTDIMYSVNYTVANDKIILHAHSRTFEFQNDMVFEIIDNASLKLPTYNSFWNERIGNSLWN